MTTEHAISDETLAKLGELPTQTLIDGLWVDNWRQSMIHGARPIFPGQKIRLSPRRISATVAPTP